MKCKICARKTGESGYCEFHDKAYENIVQKYDSWNKALGILWKEYLSEIAKNPLTGQWAKEVAKHFVNVGEEENVKEG